MNGNGALPTARVRVVTLVDYLTFLGGAERLACLIAMRLNPERFESILCVSRFPSPWDRAMGSETALEQLMKAGVRFLPLRRTRKVELAPWLRLARFLRRERVEVLHTHKFGSNVWGALVGTVARVPVLVAHEHTWSYQGQPLRRFLDRELVARAADRFIAVSRQDRRRMSEVEHIDARRTLFIPNGIEPLPPPSGRDVRAGLGIVPGAILAGAVGVLRAQKAHGVLLRALALLRADWPQLRVLIVGDGPERAGLEGLAGALGVADAVEFLGDRPDVPDLLAILDVAICCSDFEGSPLSVMEYMDAAVPIVATEVGGVPDLIEHGVHGLLVPPRDPAALADGIARVLRDRAAARAMGARARERRRSEFAIEVQVGRLEELYIELLAQHGRALPRTLLRGTAG